MLQKQKYLCMKYWKELQFSMFKCFTGDVPEMIT